MTMTNAFQKILDKSGCKPNKKWVDKGSEFCNRSMKSWLQDNDLEIYSTNEGKSVKEKFYKNMKEQNNKIYNYITSIWKMSIFIN